MGKREQKRTPLWDALCAYRAQGIIPFHVPGHKQGRGNPELTEKLGPTALGIDLTCMEGLDNILNPLDVIKEAQDLAADAFRAEHAYFLVNGTTSGIQAMIMAVCAPGEKLIVPRNAHRSVISGLILSGVQPVYLQPEVDQRFGITHGITPQDVERALREHPDARGVFVINPTYYGVASDLAGIVEVAHARNVPVLVDEAHGAHLCFHPELPPSAMEAGADLSAASTHKLAGSLTQSSLLLHQGNLVNPQRVKGVLNLTQTTSPSYILLTSLDFARKQMALKGTRLLAGVLRKARWVRKQLSRLPGIELLEEEHIEGRPGCRYLDPTKINMNVQQLGLSGQEVESILRHKYRIQVELSDLYNIILLLSIGDSWEMVQHLVASIQDLVQSLGKGGSISKFSRALPPLPAALVSPRDAFYGETKTVTLDAAEGEISAEMIMAYPPGIPLICPGERFTREIIDYVRILKAEGLILQGTEDPHLEQVKVLAQNLVLVQQHRAVGEEVGS
jgi:arginine/lysine/ornithine decarboxylase